MCFGKWLLPMIIFSMQVKDKIPYEKLKFCRGGVGGGVEALKSMFRLKFETPHCSQSQKVSENVVTKVSPAIIMWFAIY